MHLLISFRSLGLLILITGILFSPYRPHQKVFTHLLPYRMLLFILLTAFSVFEIRFLKVARHPIGLKALPPTDLNLFIFLKCKGETHSSNGTIFFGEHLLWCRQRQTKQRQSRMRSFEHPNVPSKLSTTGRVHLPDASECCHLYTREIS